MAKKKKVLWNGEVIEVPMREGEARAEEFLDSAGRGFSSGAARFYDEVVPQAAKPSEVRRFARDVVSPAAEALTRSESERRSRDEELMRRIRPDLFPSDAPEKPPTRPMTPEELDSIFSVGDEDAKAARLGTIRTEARIAADKINEEREAAKPKFQVSMKDIMRRPEEPTPIASRGVVKKESPVSLRGEALVRDRRAKIDDFRQKHRLSERSKVADIQAQLDEMSSRTKAKRTTNEPSSREMKEQYPELAGLSGKKLKEAYTQMRVGDTNRKKELEKQLELENHRAELNSIAQKQGFENSKYMAEFNDALVTRRQNESQERSQKFTSEQNKINFEQQKEIIDYQSKVRMQEALIEDARGLGANQAQIDKLERIGRMITGNERDLKEAKSFILSDIESAVDRLTEDIKLETPSGEKIYAGEDFKKLIQDMPPEILQSFYISFLRENQKYGAGEKTGEEMQQMITNSLISMVEIARGYVQNKVFENNDLRESIKDLLE